MRRGRPKTSLGELLLFIFSFWQMVLGLSLWQMGQFNWLVPFIDFTHLSDHHLLESYHRKLPTFDSTANNLPDEGHKLKLTINHLKHEMHRRKSLKVCFIYLNFFVVV